MKPNIALGELLRRINHLALAAASTGAVAALLACVLWPLRTQTRSLFA